MNRLINKIIYFSALMASLLGLSNVVYSQLPDQALVDKIKTLAPENANLLGLVSSMANQCVDDVRNQDFSTLSACAHFVESFNKHMKAFVAEGVGDRQTILGY